MDYCIRYYDRQFYTRSGISKDVAARFEGFLKDYFKSEKQLEGGIPSVKYCSKQLHISPNYLSDLLKKETGKSALDHIHAFIIDKAKTTLLNSNDPITQVAFGLGFEYSQHFSKLFKARTGMTPKEYRALNYTHRRRGAFTISGNIFLGPIFAGSHAALGNPMPKLGFECRGKRSMRTAFPSTAWERARHCGKISRIRECSTSDVS